MVFGTALMPGGGLLLETDPAGSSTYPYQTPDTQQVLTPSDGSRVVNLVSSPTPWWLFAAGAMGLSLYLFKKR